MTAKERLIQLLNRCETEDVEPAYRGLPVGNPRYTEIKAEAILKEFVRREDIQMCACVDILPECKNCNGTGIVWKEE